MAEAAQIIEDEPQDELEFMPLDDLMTERKDMFDRKKQIEEGELKAINKTLKAIDGYIIRRMQDQGLRQIQGNDGRATFSVSEEIVPEVTDWDALYAYISQHSYFHLLYRKVTARAYRELIENEEDVPGTEQKKRTTLRMRSN